MITAAIWNTPPVSLQLSQREILLFVCWVIFHDFLLSADFFQINFFKKILSGIRSGCQAVWIQIRPKILSALIWVQTVCKGDQQGKSFEYLSHFRA